jgi:hypothetical protein
MAAVERQSNADEAIRAHDYGVIKGVHKLFFYQVGGERTAHWLALGGDRPGLGPENSEPAICRFSPCAIGPARAMG